MLPCLVLLEVLFREFSMVAIMASLNGRDENEGCLFSSRKRNARNAVSLSPSERQSKNKRIM